MGLGLMSRQVIEGSEVELLDLFLSNGGVRVSFRDEVDSELWQSHN